jgi:predicted aldo/keto reductase-like oxidoreductase
MKQVQLGTTGIMTIPLVFGTLPLGPLQAGLTPEEGGRLIRCALERGVTMFDTAALYRTYPHLKSGLSGWQGPVTIASKTHAADAATARLHVEEALRELGRDRLDIVHLHAARLADPFTDRAAVLDELLVMKEEGKIAHVGMSSHYIEAFRLALHHDDIEVIHPLINRTGMGILDGTAEEMAEAIAACSRSGKGVYAMKALAGGNLISGARQNLAYVAALAGVHGVAVGMLSEQEIIANIDLLCRKSADDAVWRQLETRRRRLKIMTPFCKGCGMCIEACASGSLSFIDGKAVVDESTCVLCGYCGAACPEFMIRVV